MRNKSLHYLVRVAMLSALAVAIMQLKFPVPFAPPFYKMEFSDLPALLGAFALGPLAGVIIEAVKVLLNLLIDGTTTMYIGEAANFIMGCSFVLPAAFIYKYYRSKKGALVGVSVGTVSISVIGCIMNIFVMIPAYAYFMAPLDVIISMGTKINPYITSTATLALFAALPLNLVKGLATSILAILIYKPLRRFL